MKIKFIRLLLLSTAIMLLVACGGSTEPNIEAELKSQLEIAEQKNQQLINKAEAKVKAEAELKSQLEIAEQKNQQLINEAEARAMTEAEAKAKTEAEAKAKAEAEAEAKAKAEAEAKAIFDVYTKGQELYDEKNYSEAFEHIKFAADQEHVKAQYRLGRMYDYGRGVTQSSSEAIRLFRLAADQGYAKAQYNLGYMYENGRGVTRNYSEAAKWFKLAADQGNATGQTYLGSLYEKGRGVTLNYSEARKLYTLAKNQGDEKAKERLEVFNAQDKAKPGKMIVAQTYSGGADECLAISSENAFCIQILSFYVDAESLEKIHEGLDWATRLFPVSKNDLTTKRGIQDYLGIVLWDHRQKTSDIELLARDICLFSYDLGDGWKDDADCREMIKEKYLHLKEPSESTKAVASRADINKHSGFKIIAPYPMWSRYADGDLNSQKNDFRRNISHEYFHSYQQAHSLRVPDERVANWLIEGSAEYAANIVASKAGWIDWNHGLLWRMEAIQKALRDYPELSISMNESRALFNERIEEKYYHVVTYEMGFWATAFAASISSNDAILKDYWDDLEKYGWEKSFERNVGYSVDDFYPLFEAFLLDHADDENFDWLSSFSLID